MHDLAPFAAALLIGVVALGLPWIGWLAKTEEEMKSLPDTYVCAGCGGTFSYTDDDRAEAEAVRNHIDPEDRVVVCDSCFHALRDLSDGVIVVGPALN